mgnify:CR=1 FL=1
MKLRTRTKSIAIKTYTWKLKYRQRRRCYLCKKRNRVVYQCSRCQKGVCVNHSFLVCNKCHTCSRRHKFMWKLKQMNRMRCHLCKSRNKISYRCNVCGNGTCHSHATLLCRNCKRDCCLLQKF